MHKFIIPTLLAVIGKNSVAITTTVATAGATAFTIGADPLPWMIGAAGGAIIWSYKKPDSRWKSLSNWAISIFMGGIAATWAGHIIVSYYGMAWHGTHYVLSAVLGVGWPWLAPRTLSFIDKMISLSLFDKKA